MAVLGLHRLGPLWAWIFSMLGQLFWFYANWKAERWGIFALSVLHSLTWMCGCGCAGSRHGKHF